MIASSVAVPARFIGQHYKNYTNGAPTEAVTYGPRIWRNHSGKSEWPDIETSDGVFSWTRLDQQVAYFDGQGQDIYYQLYGTPPTARKAGAAWPTVPDQDSVVGAGCVPDNAKVERFVTALLNRYPQIKYLSPWNETKWANPVVRFQGALTGTISVGDTVTGQTSGAVGTVLAVSANAITVRLTAPAYEVTPFANNETLQRTAGNSFAATAQFAVWYWFGTLDELVMLCDTVYRAAKAARPGVIVTTPDFEGGSISSEPEWLELFCSRCRELLGYMPFDCLAYHFYNTDVRPSTKTADAYSLPVLLDRLDAVLATYAPGVPRIASELGWTPGWGGWQMQSYRAGQAMTIRRVSHYLALRGWLAAIWYNHHEEFGGAPASQSVVAAGYAAAQRIGGTTRTGYLLIDGQVASIGTAGDWVVT